MTESTSAVEQAVRARIAAARRREAERKEQRAEFAAARNAGVARRHAAKLRHLAETCEPTRRANKPPDKETSMPAALRPAHCPSCRRERSARRVATVRVAGASYNVLRCPEEACELLWLVRANRSRTAPAAA